MYDALGVGINIHLTIIPWILFAPFFILFQLLSTILACNDGTKYLQVSN